MNFEYKSQIRKVVSYFFYRIRKLTFTTRSNRKFPTQKGSVNTGFLVWKCPVAEFLDVIGTKVFLLLPGFRPRIRPLYKYSCIPLQRKSPLCIPFLGKARPQSQFLYSHSCICEGFIYSDIRYIIPSGIKRISLWRGGGGVGLDLKNINGHIKKGSR